MSKEISDEPDWMPQLRKILEETKKHHKEASRSMFHLKRKMQNSSDETWTQIETVDTFVTYFPAGGATVHDLIMFLEEHVM